MKLSAANFPDATLQQFHLETRDNFDQLSLLSFLDGVSSEMVGMGAPGTFGVTHKLGRVPRGFLVLQARGPAASTAVPAVMRRTGDRWDDKLIQLYCSAAFDSLTLWVF